VQLNGLIISDESYNSPEGFSNEQALIGLSERSGGLMSYIGEPIAPKYRLSDFLGQERQLLRLWNGRLYGAYVVDVPSSNAPQALKVSVLAPKLNTRVTAPQVIPPCPTPVATAAAK
jgi:hypothetical protein